MHLLQELVMQFHKKYGCSIGDPASPDISVDTKLGMDLIAEEFQELQFAIAGYKLDRKTGETTKFSTKKEQLHAVADALGDLAYVIQGRAIAWGIDLPGVVVEIHRSNMTKTPGHTREDGKILKGPDYTPPDLDAVFEKAKADIGDAGYGEDSWWEVPTKGLRDVMELTAKEQGKLANEIVEGWLKDEGAE